MDLFWASLALVLLLEGIGPLLFPKQWQGYLRRLSAEPISSLRQVGAVLCGGALLIYLFLA
ncbi:DUF2065 domain-containing protein [Rheinheimera riviphila]|uniref:DUF2065 domain-containing protein n=1 Tax=Rheinheimera riviphila TaxID=1834037 RepID=A0A437QFA9_9GAMM|nr:DUF2065 family protein [Rheinheimera riviphila]RVU33212.1 DUF2065 domain-containing protein [Rheinheimera riviphila]